MAVQPSQLKPTRSFLQLLLFAFIGFCLLFMYSFTNRLIDRFQVQAEIAEWQQLTEQAKDRQVALQAELDYVQSNAYIEQVAREELGMTKPGDEVIIRIPVKSTGTTVANLELESAVDTVDTEIQGSLSTQRMRSNEQPNWQRWFSWLLPKANSDVNEDRY